MLQAGYKQLLLLVVFAAADHFPTHHVFNPPCFQPTMCLTHHARWHNLITVLLPYSWLITCMCYEQQLLFLLAALALADLLPHRMPLKWPIGRCARAVNQCQEVVRQGSGNDTAQQVILSLYQDTRVNTFTKNHVRFLSSNQVSTLTSRHKALEMCNTAQTCSQVHSVHNNTMLLGQHSDCWCCSIDCKHV